jgi:hypothetical protein
VRVFTEQVFCRGRHGQESEEGKEDREGSHQEGGKEDLKEKKVIVSATEKLPPPGRNADQSETSPKDMKRPLQPFGIAARHYKAGPLCGRLLHKGPVFRLGPGEGIIYSRAKDRRRMVATLLRRGSREPGPRNAAAPLIEINFTTTRSGFVIKIKIATTSDGKEKTGDSPCRKCAEV